MAASGTTRVAIACQGGGSHSAFTGGVLQRVIDDAPGEYEVTALSGTSGGAACATIAWTGLRQDDPDRAVANLDGFWSDIAARTPWGRAANDGLLMSARLTDELGQFSISPYFNPISETGRDVLRDAITEHADLAAAVAAGGEPSLFVSAVDVRNGTFELFENGEGGVEAAIASGAIPDVFEAAEVGGEYYWDGLFSQNPPIRQFVSDAPADEKPDEIWIVRINPRTREEVPTTTSEITDRRNELAGNLSLDQERHMIESVNGMIADGIITDDRYKRIALREVDIAPALADDLDSHSKLDRDPGFIDRLMTHGRERAPTLWNG